MRNWGLEGGGWLENTALTFRGLGGCCEDRPWNISQENALHANEPLSSAIYLLVGKLHKYFLDDFFFFLHKMCTDQRASLYHRVVILAMR